MDILTKFLIALAFTVIILSAIYLFGCPIISEHQMKVLPGIAISSGVLVASLSYLKDKEKFKDERQVKHDEFQLRIAKEGFEEVYNLLKDLNNSRVVWIRASRVLLNTLKLGSSIKSEQIKEAYEIIKEDLRSKLYRLLHVSPQDPLQSDKESLPPQFFYGIENWRDKSISINDAAILSRSKIKAYYSTPDKITPEPKISELDDRSVVAIYDFILPTEDSFQDPLSKVEVWTSNPNFESGIKQGPSKYIHHLNRYYVADGKLFERETRDE